VANRVGGKTHYPKSFLYSVLGIKAFPKLTLLTGNANTVIGGQIVLPFACKIPIVTLFADTASPGLLAFNIVVGAGAYSTGSSATVTIAGVSATGDTQTTTIGGRVVASPTITTGQSATQVAAAIAAAINADPVAGLLVYAKNTAGVITITALAGGAGGNAITLTTAATGGNTTSVASAATLGGGALGTAALVADNSDTGALTTVQAAGAALFQNAPFQAGTGPKDQPLLLVVNVPQSFAFSEPDAVFGKGTILTLRTTAMATVNGAIYVEMGYIPVDPKPYQPADTNTGFSWAAIG